jgi:glycerol-3-phosphate dehydrogenase
MVTRASDYFVRRTGRLYFDIMSIATIRQPVMDIMAQELQWDDKRLKEENAILDRLITDATTYYDQEMN